MPKGTILTQKGEAKDKFYKVEVELEDGVVSGWVAEDALSDASKGNAKEEKPEAEEEEEERTDNVPVERVRRSSKLRVPKDEGLLLHRDLSFVYGVQVVPELDIMQTDIDTDVYFGFGYTAGVLVGYFTNQNLILQVEGNYGVVQGVGNTNGKELQFGFFEMNVQVRYLMERIELFGGVQYSIGLSLNDVPPELGLSGAADMSSLYVLGGVGYRTPLNEVLTLSVRARAGMSFRQAPVSIIRGGLSLILEFGG